jgi:hypothetical protein
MITNAKINLLLTECLISTPPQSESLMLECFTIVSHQFDINIVLTSFI